MLITNYYPLPHVFSITDTWNTGLLFVIDGQGELKKPGYMKAILKMWKVRNDLFNYLHSSGFSTIPVVFLGGLLSGIYRSENMSLSF